jgi:hypothetical protein
LHVDGRRVAFAERGSRADRLHPAVSLVRRFGLYTKSYGKESHLSYLAHALVENRNGLIAAAMATTADGYAERQAALLMILQKQKSGRIKLGADKAANSKDFVEAAHELNVTLHATENQNKRRTNLDRRTMRRTGYAIWLSHRWLAEKGFG